MDAELVDQGASAAELNAGGGHHAGGGSDPASAGPTTIYREADDDEEQIEVEVDITESHFKYTKLRSAFGKQTQFLEDRTRIHCGLRANTTRYHSLFQQQKFVHKAEDTLEALRDLTTNTTPAEYRSFSVLHTEGGWPREINVRERDTVERTRRRFQREESFQDAVPNLAREAEYLVKHNNTLGLCEPLNRNPYVSKRDSKPYASVIAVYKCPSDDLRRPVSRITFAPGNQGRMAVAYCPYEFDPTFREHSCEAFFWEVENATRPEGMVRSAAQIVDLQYHPTDVHSICGGLFTGQVCTWDNRVGPNPQSISSFETSHEDVCTRAMWTNRGGATHEFFSVGLDGGIVWWDERNLSSRIDSVYADVEIGRNDPKQAVPITALAYDPALKDKFIVGTQFGQVLPFSREQKKVGESQNPMNVSEAQSKMDVKNNSGMMEKSQQSMKRGSKASQMNKKDQQSMTKSTKTIQKSKDRLEDEDENEEETSYEDEELEGIEEEDEEEMDEGNEDEDEEEWDEDEDEDEDEFDGADERYNKITVRTPPSEEETVSGPFKIVSVYEAHRGPVSALQRCPAFPSYFMSCGGYHLRFYSEDVLESGILCTSPGDALYSYCQWLNGRPCSVVASRIDGCLEFWDLLIQGSSSILTTKICDEALSTVCPSDDISLIAAGTVFGDIRMVQVCPSLTNFDDADRDALGQLFYREARREQYLADRMRTIKKDDGSTMQSAKPSRSAAAKAPISKPGAGAGKKGADISKSKGAEGDNEEEETEAKKPDPYKNPDILVDKKFFDMLAEEKKRQGINAFPDKKGQAQEYSKMLIEGRQSEKQSAVEKSHKVNDSELGAQEMLDVNESVLRKADAYLEEEGDEMDEDDEEEGNEDDEEEDEEEDNLSRMKSGKSMKSGGNEDELELEEEEDGDDEEEDETAAAEEDEQEEEE